MPLTLQEYPRSVMFDTFVHSKQDIASGVLLRGETWEWKELTEIKKVRKYV